jgi:hypothetical protein
MNASTSLDDGDTRAKTVDRFNCVWTECEAVVSSRQGISRQLVYPFLATLECEDTLSNDSVRKHNIGECIEVYSIF